LADAFNNQRRVKQIRKNNQRGRQRDEYAIGIANRQILRGLFPDHNMQRHGNRKRKQKADQQHCLVPESKPNRDRLNQGSHDRFSDGPQRQGCQRISQLAAGQKKSQVVFDRKRGPHAQAAFCPGLELPHPGTDGGKLHRYKKSVEGHKAEGCNDFQDREHEGQVVPEMTNDETSKPSNE
jgi:hypothetical protein